MTQPTIQTLLNGYFNADATWQSSSGYASIQFDAPNLNSPPVDGGGDPCHFVAVYSRKDPTAGPVFHTVSTSNTQVPSGLDAYLTDDYLMFWISVAFVTQMPQGDLFNMLNANGGGSKLHQMEILTTSFACGTACGMVYMMATVPGQFSHGIEFFKFRDRSTGHSSGSKDIIYSNMGSQFMMLLQLMPSTTGLYSPIEVT